VSPISTALAASKVIDRGPEARRCSDGSTSTANESTSTVRTVIDRCMRQSRTPAEAASPGHSGCGIPQGLMQA
jgi:hypothetical protein